MKITEIEGKVAKLGRSSITVKNDDGKTVGVVCGLVRWNDLQYNKQILFKKETRHIWSRRRNYIHFSFDNVYYLDGKLYFIYSDKSDFFCKFHNYNMEDFQERQEILKSIEDDGMIVIHVKSY